MPPPAHADDGWCCAQSRRKQCCKCARDSSRDSSSSRDGSNGKQTGDTGIFSSKTQATDRKDCMPTQHTILVWHLTALRCYDVLHGAQLNKLTTTLASTVACAHAPPATERNSVCSNDLQPLLTSKQALAGVHLRGDSPCCYLTTARATTSQAANPTAGDYPPNPCC